MRAFQDSQLKPTTPHVTQEAKPKCTYICEENVKIIIITRKKGKKTNDRSIHLKLIKDKLNEEKKTRENCTTGWVYNSSAEHAKQRRQQRGRQERKCKPQAVVALAQAE